VRIRSLLAVAALAAATVVAVVQPADAVTTNQVQFDLAGMAYLGFGDVDGATGPKTTAAVKAFQTDRCLDVDGVAGVMTTEELDAQVTKVQQVVGADPDGEFGPATEAAVKAWQGLHSLAQTGQADATTMTAMGITRVKDCTPPPPGVLAAAIVQIAQQEAANPARNHEIGGYNCNYYTTALGLSGTGAHCSNGWKTQAWCADFGKWVWNQAGAKTTYVTSYYSSFQTYGQNFGTWHAGSPQPGDAIVFNYGHVGLVVSATSSSVTYISGNTSNPATGNDDALLQKTVSRSYSAIVGYASPVAR
jgi:peptidoglycan hydrolase-like protein with peptidoglycan-binding domain